MKIACVGYRDWALQIYDHLRENTSHQFLIIRNRDEFDESTILDFGADFVLFYGWSWKVSQKLIESDKCVMLHPSPLPKYRGGSPIQNQIIDGNTESAITLFMMNSEMDAGDILLQEKFSLGGSIDDIFGRITQIGIKLSLLLFAREYVRQEQDHGKASYCQRRSPLQSEITPEELASKPAEYLYNKIRMLQDPYPNAFFRAADGKRLYITAAYLDKSEREKK